ncbi:MULTISPECIES: transposase, partial [Pseudomonas]
GLVPSQRTPRSDILIAILEALMAQQTRRSYTDDFKAQAVTLAESIGRGEAARQLDISVKTLGNWLDAARNGRPLSSPARHPVSDLESELARLRAENATLKMEREILKKATAFFAKESN